MPSPSVPVIIYGLKHAGKTLISRGLSGIWGCQWHDLDILAGQELAQVPPTGSQEIEHSRAMELVRSYYRTHGVQAFQELEARCFGRFLDSNAGNPEPWILALGGGAVDNQELMRRALAARKAGVLWCFLDLPEGLLLSRLLRTGIPPFLDPEDPAGSFHILYQRRRRLALQGSDLVIPLGDADPETALELCKTTIQECLDGRKQFR